MIGCPQKEPALGWLDLRSFNDHRVEAKGAIVVNERVKMAWTTQARKQRQEIAGGGVGEDPGGINEGTYQKSKTSSRRGLNAALPEQAARSDSELR